jgi:hypothetical protein
MISYDKKLEILGLTEEDIEECTFKDFSQITTKFFYN